MMVTKIYRFILILGFSLFSLSNTWSQDNRDDFSKKSFVLDPTVRYGKLKNGFTYYIKKHENPEANVKMKLVVKTGSFLEDDKQIEYAHLLEHVGLFNTKNYPDLRSTLNDAVILSNASTSHRSTNYWLSIDGADKEKIGLGLNVLKDWSSAILLEPSRIEVQRGALLGEIRNLNPYQHGLFEFMNKILLKNTGFPFLYEEERINSIKNFKLAAFQKFHKDWYRPDLQAAIVVGDINIDNVETDIISKFSELKGPSRASDSKKVLKKITINLKGENQYEHFTDSININRRLVIFAKDENHSFKIGSEYDYYKKVTQDLYKYIVSNRSKDLLKQYDPPFEHFTTEYLANTNTDGQFDISRVEVNLGKSPKQLEEKVIAAIKAYKKIYSDFTQEELQVAKVVLANRLNEISFTNSKLVNDYEKHFLSGNAPATEKQLVKFRNIIDKVNLSEVQDQAHKRRDLHINKDFVFINVPDKFQLKERKIVNWINTIENSQLPIYQPQVKKVENLDYELPDVVNLKKYEKLSKNLIGVNTINLENGIKVLLKPSLPQSKDFDNQIVLSGFKPIILPKYSEDKYLTAKLAYDYASFTGIGNYDKFEIDQFMQDKEMQLRFNTDMDDYLIEGKFKRKDINEFFKILFLKIGSPEVHKKVFEAWKENKYQSFVDYINRSSTSFVREEIEKQWYPNQPHLKESFLNTVNQDDLMKEYKEHFSNFDNYTFIVTGDFKTHEILPEICTYLSSLPVKEHLKIGGSPYREFEMRSRRDTIKFKNISQAYVELYFPVKAPTDVKTEAVLGLIAQALRERIFKRLRIGTYAPVVGGEWINYHDGIYAYRISFDSELGNEEKMIGYALEEFQDLQKFGINQKWLKVRLKSEKEDFYNRLGSFGYFNFWPEYLKTNIKNNKNSEDEILQAGTLLEHFIDVEDVNEGIKTYLTEENMQLFLGLPE